MKYDDLIEIIKQQQLQTSFETQKFQLSVSVVEAEKHR